MIKIKCSKRYKQGKDLFEAFCRDVEAKGITNVSDPLNIKCLLNYKSFYRSKRLSKTDISFDDEYVFSMIGKAYAQKGTLHIFEKYNSLGGEDSSYYIDVIPKGYFVCEDRDKLNAWLEKACYFHDLEIHGMYYDAGHAKHRVMSDEYSELKLELTCCTLIFRCVKMASVITDWSYHSLYSADIAYENGLFYFIEDGQRIGDIEAILEVMAARTVVVARHLLLPNKGPYDD